LTVFGLSCPLCSNNLDGHLRRIDGVEDATINLDTGEVTARFAPGHDVSGARLARAVRDAGFTLKDIQPVRRAE
jgi:copper chaperone CopZ